VLHIVGYEPEAREAMLQLEIDITRDLSRMNAAELRDEHWT
jgi:hypothetical protein